MDQYGRMRVDRMAEDVAVTRNKVEAIERMLNQAQEENGLLERRVRGLERRVFVLWLIGPLVLGGITFFTHLKNGFTTH